MDSNEKDEVHSIDGPEMFLAASVVVVYKLVKVIRNHWHGEQGWDFYLENSPELKIFRAWTQLLDPPMGLDAPGNQYAQDFDEMEKQILALTEDAHYGDPCIKCGGSQNDVEPGPCPGHK